MGRHQTAINRYVAIVFAIPLVLAVITFLYTNSYPRPYLVWITPANLFTTVTFIIAGLVALVFEVPFSKPDMIASTRGGKLGTALIFGFAVIPFFTFAGLILSGYYNIFTDTGIGNFFLSYIFLPVMIGMFSLEMYETVVKQRRFAVHNYLKA